MDEAAPADGAGVASRPQHLLLTLLGDFWYGQNGALPSTALVRLLGEFGVGEGNARAAVGRLARRGLLVATRSGRRTAYALTAEGHETLVEGTRRIFGFGARPRPWDGYWTFVAFSVPEQNRSQRAALRTRLRWAGFAPRFDGVWAAPGDRSGAAAQVLAAVALTTASVIVGPTSGPADHELPDTWPLGELRVRYEEFLRDTAALANRRATSGLTDAEALVGRTQVIDRWRVFPGLDPELPDELAPRHWPAARARSCFTELYDQLGPQATARVRELVALDDVAAAVRAAHHTSAEALAFAGERSSPS